MFPKAFRWLLLVLSSVFVLLNLAPVGAGNTPKLVLAPVWREPGILSSIDKLIPNLKDGDDDFRYIDVDLYATSSMEFWSVQITCTATPNALISYNDPTIDTALGDGDPSNTLPAVIWGPEWGSKGTEFLDIVDPYNATTGARTITAARLGNSTAPMGSSVSDHVFLLATLRFRGKGTVLYPAVDASLTCAGSVMARNGVVLAPITYVIPPLLKVAVGYRVSGVVRYEGRPPAANAGISVLCENPQVPGSQGGSTSATGDWFFMTRTPGDYKCDYYGNIVNKAAGYQPDRYLAASTTFSLYTYEMKLKPVTLLGGNFPTDQSVAVKDEVIDLSDIAVITAGSNWLKAVAGGDVNGDGKTDKSDFTIAASNYGQSEVTDARHVFYSVPRYGESWQRGQIWMGRSDAGAVVLALKNDAPNSRDLWAAFSPDNVSIAFARDTNSNDNGMVVHNTTLYVGNFLFENTVPKALTPPDSHYQAFAPSWSRDSKRIAFICSTYNPGGPSEVAHGYLADEGHVCLIDADGKNFVDLTPDANPVKARIYPPAWLSDHELVFGGASVTDSVCDGNLCLLNIDTGEITLFDNDLVICAGIVDMPVIRQNNLFYRSTCSAEKTSRLRWAHLNYQNKPNYIDPIEALPGTAPWTHTFVMGVDGKVSKNVDYYTVSQVGMSLMIAASDNTVFYNAEVTGDSYTTPYRWAFSSSTHAVNGMMSNPTPPNTPYDFTDVNDPSWLFAYRNTLDWQP